MSIIARDPKDAASRKYDVIIIGAGISGVMLTYEASCRGLKPLLIERDDFGENTTFSSLRIVHGGFRYLQNLDIKRLAESVAERRFFLKTFPDLVRPLPCLMPLYGEGLRRPVVLRLGLLAYDILSGNRNRGVVPERKISSGLMLDREETRRAFPLVDMEGLKGGAVWYDAIVPDSQRLIVEVLRLSTEHGATVLNYVEAGNLLLNGGKRVAGVAGVDRASGESFEFRGDTVINAGGPWCRDLAARFDRDEPALFRSMLAWNVLFDRKPLGEYGVAVAPKKPKGRTYFLLPYKGKVFAGTGHAPWLSESRSPMPSREGMEEFLADLNMAIPGFNAGMEDILRVFPGLQSAKKEGGTDFAVRDVFVDHSAHGGPGGFYTISGVKLTTARRLAERTLSRIFPGKAVPPDLSVDGPFTHKPISCGKWDYECDWRPAEGDTGWEEALKALIAEEAVLHLDDLVLRRTTLWENPFRAVEIAPLLCRLFSWDGERTKTETERLKEKLLNRNLFI
jgi:glycerol-3-phosphate dehydrogenase